MSPLIIVAAIAGIGYMLTRKPKAVASEAPKDAQSLFATMLAPSLTDVSQLQQFYNTFIAAGQNQAASNNAAVRLSLYALATFLKACMLSRGAQPQSAELLAIGNAPVAGFNGVHQLPDAGSDQVAAVAAALAPNYTDVGGLGQYIQAVASTYIATGKQPGPQPFGSSLTVPTIKKPRLKAYLLAMKAKQMCLTNPVSFAMAETTAPAAFYCIANMPAASVPPDAANSIFSFQ